ncbi:MAG: hypothetical protein M3N32_12005 [Actinomycetota bacterium]|nr:hypothetical protein [Actinomycetota bacterium]
MTGRAPDCVGSPILALGVVLTSPPARACGRSLAAAAGVSAGALIGRLGVARPVPVLGWIFHWRGLLRRWPGGWWRCGLLCGRLPCGWWPCGLLSRGWLPRSWLPSGPRVRPLGRGRGLADWRWRGPRSDGADVWNVLATLQGELDADLGERILRLLGGRDRKTSLEELADEVQRLRPSDPRHRRRSLELRDRLSDQLVDALGSGGRLTQPTLREAHPKLRVIGWVPLDRERQTLCGTLQPVEGIIWQSLLCSRVRDSPREGQRCGGRRHEHGNATTQAQEWSTARGRRQRLADAGEVPLARLGWQRLGGERPNLPGSLRERVAEAQACAGDEFVEQTIHGIVRPRSGRPGDTARL